MTGVEAVIGSLLAHRIDTVFYGPGGSFSPVIVALARDAGIRVIASAHDDAAVHMAQGYAHATGLPGVVFIGTRRGIFNAMPALADATIDQARLLVLVGMIPGFVAGAEASGGRPGLARSVSNIRQTSDIWPSLDGALRRLKTQPGPALFEISAATLAAPAGVASHLNGTAVAGEAPVDADAIQRLVALIETSERPVFLAGGGLIESGATACQTLRDLVRATGIPVTTTMKGLGAYPATGQHWLGMAGVYGLYQANQALHQADLVIGVGLRFEGRLTGRPDGFSPNARRVLISDDPEAAAQAIRLDLPIRGDAGSVLAQVQHRWREGGKKLNRAALAGWRKRIDAWRAVNCLDLPPCPGSAISPRFALSRLDTITRYHSGRIIVADAGIPQIRAAQYLGFEAPRSWFCSGGLGASGSGLPVAIGAQLARPNGLVISITDETSCLTQIRELATAGYHNAPVKCLVLNGTQPSTERPYNLPRTPGAVPAWTDAQPDLARLAASFNCQALTCTDPADLDSALRDMLNCPGHVLLDCRVRHDADCLPMIAPGQPHQEMLLPAGSLKASITHP